MAEFSKFFTERKNNVGAKFLLSDYELILLNYLKNTHFRDVYFREGTGWMLPNAAAYYKDKIYNDYEYAIPRWLKENIFAMAFLNHDYDVRKRITKSGTTYRKRAKIKGLKKTRWYTVSETEVLDARYDIDSLPSVTGNEFDRMNYTNQMKDWILPDEKYKAIKERLAAEKDTKRIRH